MIGVSKYHQRSKQQHSSYLEQSFTTSALPAHLGWFFHAKRPQHFSQPPTHKLCIITWIIASWIAYRVHLHLFHGLTLPWAALHKRGGPDFCGSHGTSVAPSPHLLIYLWRNVSPNMFWVNWTSPFPSGCSGLSEWWWSGSFRGFRCGKLCLESAFAPCVKFLAVWETWTHNCLQDITASCCWWEYAAMLKLHAREPSHWLFSPIML